MVVVEMYFGGVVEVAAAAVMVAAKSNWLVIMVWVVTTVVDEMLMEAAFVFQTLIWIPFLLGWSSYFHACF